MKALFSHNLTLEAAIVSIRTSVSLDDAMLLAEHIELFNSLALPFMFIGVHEKDVHLTYVSTEMHSLEASYKTVTTGPFIVQSLQSQQPVVAATSFPIHFVVLSSAHMELIELVDVVWRLDPALWKYIVVKDRTGLYKGTYDV